jgi:outer membrane protein TolC
MKSIETESFSESLVALDLEQQIRNRAYQLYEKRGKVDGFDVDDWLDAEAEVLDERDMVSAA